MIKAKMYYECHVTCKESENFDHFRELLNGSGWKASRFSEDDVDNMSGKWFATMRTIQMLDAIQSLKDVTQHLAGCDYVVLRAKIEDTLFDTDFGDKL